MLTGQSTAMTAIKRVVSSFLLTGGNTRDDVQVAVFHRTSTMPTFPSHWAPCSGSLEINETPWQAALRELYEETNLEMTGVEPSKQHGLYVDVPHPSGTKSMRIYPFSVRIPSDRCLELRGTEHDTFQFVSVDELEELQPSVPALATSFHHATFGAYLKVSPKVRAWASDKIHGAATLAKQALELMMHEEACANDMKMMRPTMVAITNVLNQDIPVEEALDSYLAEGRRAVEFAADYFSKIMHDRTNTNKLRIATFSRSSTLVNILLRLREKFEDQLLIQCSKSTPGDEGEIMARDDLGGVTCLSDDKMFDAIQGGQVDVLLVGSDCVMEEFIVNKIGTARLALAAQETCCVVCCADQYKLWDDIFSPPLEPLFECIPRRLFHDVLIPPRIK